MKAFLTTIWAGIVGASAFIGAQIFLEHRTERQLLKMAKEFEQRQLLGQEAAKRAEIDAWIKLHRR
jgi:hypothetical protein